MTMVKRLRRKMKYGHANDSKNAYDYTLILLKSFYLADFKFIYRFKTTNGRVSFIFHPALSESEIATTRLLLTLAFLKSFYLEQPY